MDADRLCRRWPFVLLLEIHSCEWFFQGQAGAGFRQKSGALKLFSRCEQESGTKNQVLSCWVFERCLAGMLPIAERPKTVYGLLKTVQGTELQKLL